MAIKSIQQNVERRRQEIAQARKRGAIFVPKRKAPVEKTYAPLRKNRSARPQDVDPYETARSATDPEANIKLWRERNFKAQFDPKGNMVNRVGGPQGEDLPYGAKGWDWFGRPYYGEGFTGWMNRMFYKTFWPYEEAPGDLTIKRPVQDMLGRIDPTRLGETEEVYSLPKIWQAIKANDTPLGFMARGMQELVGGVIDVFAEGAKQVERGIGAVAEVADVGETDYKQDSSQAQWVKKHILKPLNIDPNFVAYLHEMSPQVLLGNFAKGLATKSKEELKADLETGYQAGRVLYSSFANPSIKGEFVRRYQEGENPTFLAQQLENPWAEMIGQAVLDPLNVVSPIMKGMREASRLRRAVDTFARMEPELEAVMAVGDFSKVTKLNDVVASAGKMDEIAKAEMIAAKRISQGLSDWSEHVGLLELTPHAKAGEFGQTTGELFGQLAAAHRQDPDTVAALMKGLYQRAHGAHTNNLDEVATGIVNSMHAVQPRLMFSKAGHWMGEALYQLLGDDPGKFFDELAKHADDEKKLIEFASKKMNGIAEKMFPTAIERMKAGEKVNWLEGTLAKIDKGLQSNVYKPANSFYAGMYMGLNPAWAVRNFATNELTIAVDYGVGPLFDKPSVIIEDSKAYKELLEYYDGSIPLGFGGFSGGTAGVDVAKGIKGLPPARFAEWSEKWASLQVISASTRNTMERMLQPGRALASVDDIVAAGIDRRSAEMLYDLAATKFKGNVGKAVTEFMEKAKTGDLWALDTLAFMAKKDIQVAKKWGVADEILNVLQDVKQRGGSVDEAVAGIDGIMERFRIIASKVADETPVVARDAHGAETIENMMAALHNGEVDEMTYKAATHYTQANSNAIDAYRQAVQQSIQGQPLPPDLQQQVMRYLADNAPQIKAEQQARLTTVMRMRDKSLLDNFDVAKAWNELGIKGDVPLNATEFRNRLWTEYYFDPIRKQWQVYRDAYARVGDEILAALQKANIVDPNQARRIEIAQKQLELARDWDNVLRDDEVRRGLVAAMNRGDWASANAALAHKYGIASITEKGAKLDDTAVLSTINKYLPEGMEKFEHLREVPPEVAEMAFQRRMSAKAGLLDETATAAAQVPAPATAEDLLARAPAGPQVAPPYAGQAMGMPRVVYEQLGGLEDLFGRIRQGVVDNWDKYNPSLMNPEAEAALKKWAEVSSKRVAEARLLSAAVADAAREFTLLNYQKKRYLDLALGYVYPWHYFYTHTYGRWMQRLAYNPEVIANYARYKDTLSKVHAGAPDWWKYQVNSNELLGLDDENPLYFNLEATLNPLNGLTGVDFEDPQKRLGWWTKTLDDLGKFGPATFAPLSAATALALAWKGEQDAAARWGGRLIPQTATLKSILALSNVNIPTGQGLNEFDPFVFFLSNGLDVWERGRAGRALGSMVENGELTQAEAIEAAYYQKGDVWQRAVERAMDERAPGQLVSFFAGVGFKPRSPQDMAIDNFYAEYRRFWDNRMDTQMTPDEVAEGMDELRKKYPFMDTVLLAKEKGLDRDRAYVYSVLSRIPPGQKSALAELVGVQPELMDKFYDEKGNLEKMAETDRQSLMAGMLALGALLEIPDDATRSEYRQASKLFKDMKAAIKTQFGEDIEDMIITYKAIRRTSTDNANAFLDEHPEVKEAMNFEDSAIVNDPLMRKYYGSIYIVRSYLRSKMFDAIEEELGSDFWERRQKYYDLKLEDPRQASAYYKTIKKDVSRYYELLDFYEKAIGQELADIDKYLGEKPYPALQKNLPEVASTGQQKVLDYLKKPAQPEYYDWEWEDWQGVLSQPLQRVLEDHFIDGHNLPDAAMDALDRVAQPLDADPETILELIGRKIYQ